MDYNPLMVLPVDIQPTTTRPSSPKSPAPSSTSCRYSNASNTCVLYIIDSTAIYAVSDLAFVMKCPGFATDGFPTSIPDWKRDSMTLGNVAERSQERPEDHQKALEDLAARIPSSIIPILHQRSGCIRALPTSSCTAAEGQYNAPTQ